MSISVLRSALLSLLLLVGTTGSIASNWSSWPHQSRATEPLSAEHVFTLTPVQAVGSKPTVTGNIASNHYIYRTSLKAEDAAGNPVELQLPAGVIHEDEFFGKTEVYESPSISIGFVNTAAQEVTLHWQGCATSGICYPPQVATVALADHTSTATPSANNSVAKIKSAPTRLSEEQEAAEKLTSLNPIVSAAVFLGFGLLLAFTPCSLPMIPIVSTIVIGGASARRALALACTYTVSMAAVYAGMGVLAGLLGANLQAALQTPWLLSAFAALFVVLAISLFGAFELRMPAVVQQRLNTAGQGQKGGSLPGAMFLGVLSALLVGPCMTAPLAGAMLYVGQSGSAATGGIALFMLGIGMGVPLVLIASFGARLLPKPGPWMERVRTAFGYVMLGMAILILSRFLPESIGMALWGSLLVATAVGLFGWASSAPTLDGRALGMLRSLGMLSGIWGLLVLIGASMGSQSLAAPLSRLGTQTAVPAPGMKFIAAQSISDVDRHLAAASAQGQWTLIDFYADWCISCHVNEKNALRAPKVVERLSQLQVLRPDVTANVATSKELLQRWGVQGPPTMLLVGPDGKERRAQRLIGELTEQQLLEALDEAGA